MKHFQLYRNIIALAIIALLSGGAVVYADFIRTSGSKAGFGYGYGYDTDTLEYGYGYGYHSNASVDDVPEDRELYGFPGTSGIATSITASVTSCTTATISYTSDYLAKHLVRYGVAAPTESATSLTAYESGANSISLTGLSASTTYLYVVASLDIGGNAWPSAQSSFTTSACSSGGGGGAVLYGAGQNLINTNQNSGNGSVSSNTLFPRNILKSGIKGDDIKKLQQCLNNQGMFVANKGAGAPGKETTLFGSLTKKALKKFQKANGLKQDGIFGPLTRAVAESVCK